MKIYEFDLIDNHSLTDEELFDIALETVLKDMEFEDELFSNVKDKFTIDIQFKNTTNDGKLVYNVSVLGELN